MIQRAETSSEDTLNGKVLFAPRLISYCRISMRGRHEKNIIKGTFFIK